MNFRECNLDGTESDYKTKLYTLFWQYIFLNIFLGLRCRFFLNETSILIFAKLIFHSFYLNKNELRKNCLEIH